MSFPPARDPIGILNADLLRVLAHPARVRLLALLGDRELAVGAMQTALALDSSGTSQHLAALRKQGVIVARKEGRSVYYRIRDRRTIELLELATEIVVGRLEEDRAILDELMYEPAHDGARGDRSQAQPRTRRPA